MPVHLDPKGIKLELGINAGGKVQKYFVNTCYKHMDRFVPRRLGEKGGSLRETVTFDDSGITYEMPYARYQYYGEREDGTHKVKNYSTQGTGPYWDERMWNVDREKIVQEVQKEFERGG